MIIALRDLGATLALRFVRVPEINDWIKQRDTITRNFNNKVNLITKVNNRSSSAKGEF